MSSEEREEIVANKKAKAESACATAIGYELGSEKLKELVSDVNRFTATDKTNSINNPTVINSRDGWTYNKVGWGGDPGVMTGNGLEVFQGAGIFTQTVTGLAAGLYKVTVNGFYRDGSNADCSAKSNDGWKLSNAYLEANGNQTMLADWASDRASDHLPNIPAEAKNLFNNGKYLNEVFAIVGDDGELEINLAQPGGAVGGRWLFFSNFTLTYYSDQVSDDAANSLIASMPTGKMNNDVKAEMVAAKEVFEANKTIANYNVLSEAINAANASITAYANAKAYFDSAESILAGTNVYTEEAYNQYFATPLAKYNDGTLENAEASSFVKHSTGWHSTNTIDDILLSAWTIGGEQAKDYDKALYINTWSVEGISDGSEFLAPFFEYWGDDKLSLATTDIQAKVTGLEPSTTYSFTIRARVRQTNDKTKIENGITMKVGDGEAVDISSGAKFKDTQFYIGNFTAVGETDAEGTLTATITVADGCNVSWLSFYNANYTEGEDLSAYIADYKFALETANQLLKDAKYVNVTGVEREKLQEVVAEYAEVEFETKDDYIATKKALDEAASTFTSVKASYDEYVSIKNLAANYEELAYASAEKKETLNGVCTVDNPVSAEEAGTKVAAITTALRAYVESNGIAEGVDGAEDMTSLIANANFESGLDNWNSSQSGGNLGTLKNEPLTDSKGNTYSYYDYYNGSANNQEASQTIENLPAGRYIFTVSARAAESLNNVFVVMGDKEVAINKIGASGGVFGRGWNDYTVVYDNPKTQNVTIKVYSSSNGGNKAGWFGFTRARLVKIAEGANMTITDAGWATFIAPFEVEIPEGVTAYTVAGVKANNYLNKTALETVIPANTPVLLEGAAMTETFYGLSTATQNTYGEVLVGNVSGKTMNVSAGSYVLLNQNDKLGFYQVKSDEDNVTVGNNRCYLNVPAGGEVKAFFFDDEATGINGVETLTDGTVESIFTISGTRVNSLQKGLNIVKMSNGKTQKVLVK